MGLYAAYNLMITTIRVNQKTRDMLKRIGKKGETYDQVILRLLEEKFYKELDESVDREERMDFEKFV
jgi:hypothetical protein